MPHYHNIKYFRVKPVAYTKKMVASNFWRLIFYAKTKSEIMATVLTNRLKIHRVFLLNLFLKY